MLATTQDVINITGAAVLMLGLVVLRGARTGDFPKVDAWLERLPFPKARMAFGLALVVAFPIILIIRIVREL